MNQFLGKLKRPRRDQRGAEMVEWVVVVAVLAVAIVGGLSLLGIPADAAKSLTSHETGSKITVGGAAGAR